MRHWIWFGFGFLFWVLFSWTAPATAGELEAALEPPPADALTTESGLVYQVLKKGKGKAKPSPNDRVVVHYTGWQVASGRKFDSSYDRDEPMTLGVTQVIDGWVEALQLMRLKEKGRLWIPAELAYGTEGTGPQPYGDLVFEIELLKILKGQPNLEESQRQPPENAETTEGGVAFVVLKKGKGKAIPTSESILTVHYSGWRAEDGVKFDSSLDRNEPVTLKVNQVIKAWAEYLPKMKRGETARIWVPAELAYGTEGPPGPPYGPLVFDITLLAIQAPPAGIPEPERAPPDSAKVTDSGLSYQVIKRGKGRERPSATSLVTVHYTGWMAENGKIFDSSEGRGPRTFPLDQVVEGWAEGLQLMRKNGKMRFWIPGDLAYGETPRFPGAPSGLLIFDVHLIDFQSVETP